MVASRVSWFLSIRVEDDEQLAHGCDDCGPLAGLPAARKGRRYIKSCGQVPGWQRIGGQGWAHIYKALRTLRAGRRRR